MKSRIGERREGGGVIFRAEEVGMLDSVKLLVPQRDWCRQIGIER